MVGVGRAVVLLGVGEGWGEDIAVAVALGKGVASGVSVQAGVATT